MKLLLILIGKGSDNYEYDNEKLRVPSWTDRIFYCNRYGIRNIYYNSINNIRYSDHRPVVGVFQILCGKDKTSRRTRSSGKYCQNKNNMIGNSTNKSNITEINSNFIEPKSSKNIYNFGIINMTNIVNNKLNTNESNDNKQQNKNNISINNFNYNNNNFQSSFMNLHNIGSILFN